MKTRNGFVSNSSSSSFIVAFDKRPETPADLKEALFDPDQKMWVGAYNGSWNVDEIVSAMMCDGEIGEDVTRERLIEIIRSGHFDGYPENPTWNRYDLDFGSPEWDRLNEQHDAVVEEAAGRVAACFLTKLQEKTALLHWEFADDCGGQMEADMEHGNLFRNLHHIRISKH